jgi:hypothetical protein
MRSVSIVRFLHFRIFSAFFFFKFCPLKLQHKLAYTFLFHYHGL